MLTRGDDFPIHQTSQPIAFSGTDRNFYDRYFFNGQGPDGADFFAMAFGVYPHLNIADASFCVVRNGVQACLHASRWLMSERMEIAVGPISIEVVKPLEALKIVVEAPSQGMRAELAFAGRAFPIEEPRFLHHNGPRTVMDYTRLTQNGAWTGWIELDGERRSVDGFTAIRDRSWGVRSIGARDPQETVPPAPPQFYWIWAPANFPTGAFFFHSNEDGAGMAWNRRAVWARQGADAAGLHEIGDPALAIEWKSGTRHARRAVVTVGEQGRARQITYEPDYEFLMLGLGYGHPKWGHGMAHGALDVEREDFALGATDPRLPQNLHVQAVCKVTYSDDAGDNEEVGRGVLEQLVFGPHAPSGFKETLDFAQ